jgi:tetratricopeptide (TPR) repeat protein
LGVIDLQNGDFPSPIARISAAIDLNPNIAEFHLNLGSAWQGQAAMKKAVDCFRRALELNSSFALAHGNLANALRTGGHLEEALSHYALRSLDGQHQLATRLKFTL